MENFLTWDVLLTYAGCVAGTIVVTEFIKKLAPKLIPQLVSFVVAILILGFGHLATGDFAWTEAPLYLINAIAVSIASNGGFDILKKAFGKKEEPITEEIVIDHNQDEDGNNGVYLSFSKNPDEFKDGDVIQFKVKKVSQK